jgi:hypothetical protein
MRDFQAPRSSLQADDPVVLVPPSASRAAFLLPLMLLVSCIDDFEQFAVGVCDGQPVAISTPCDGQDVVSVEIVVPEDDIVGDGDDEVLWRAVARYPRPTSFATPIGEAPDGSETTIELEEPLRDDREYSLYMQWHSGEAGAVILFRPSLLEPGLLESQRGAMTPQRFLGYAAEGCGGGLAEGAAAAIRSAS